jgi:hypothetical protein
MLMRRPSSRSSGLAWLPDGSGFVYALTEGDDFTGALIEPDSWIVERDGSGATLLVDNAYAPAWSW